MGDRAGPPSRRSDDGRTVAIGTRSGKVLVTPAGGGAPRTLAALHAPIGCLDVAHAGRAVVAAAGRSFVDEDGTTWLKALDLAGVAESYVPVDPAVAQRCPRSTAGGVRRSGSSPDRPHRRAS